MCACVYAWVYKRLWDIECSLNRRHVIEYAIRNSVNGREAHRKQTEIFNDCPTSDDRLITESPICFAASNTLAYLFDVHSVIESVVNYGGLATKNNYQYHILLLRNDLYIIIQSVILILSITTNCS